MSMTVASNAFAHREPAQRRPCLVEYRYVEDRYEVRIPNDVSLGKFQRRAEAVEKAVQLISQKVCTEVEVIGRSRWPDDAQ